MPRFSYAWSSPPVDTPCYLSPIAAGFRDAAAAFVERQALRPGTRVLDAACGSGKLTIPAARSGADVTRLVTRPGGRVVLANWTPGGFVGRMFAIHARPAPPAPGAPSPLLWGDDSAIRQRFGWRDWDVSTTTRTLTFRFPSDPAGTAAAAPPTARPSVPWK